MSALNNYPLEFVERTIRLLEELENPAKDADLEVTLLLNCMLGLLVSVSEMYEENYAIAPFLEKLGGEKLKGLIPAKMVTLKPGQPLKPYKDEINEKEFLKHFSGPDRPKMLVKDVEIELMSRKDIENSPFCWLLKKLRNGIAHHNIHPINRHGKWKGIRIWNFKPNGVKDFAIELSVIELRNLALEIAHRFVTVLKDPLTPERKELASEC